MSAALALALVATTLGCSADHRSPAAPAGALPQLRYRVTPAPARDRTDLAIELRFAGPWPETVELVPPVNCYGSGLDLSSSLVSIRAGKNTSLARPDPAVRRWTLSIQPGAATVRYVLSFDPDRMERDAFAPSTSATHFHVAGCQWMLTVGDMREARDVSVELTGVPAGWSVYSSLAASGAAGRVRGNEDVTAPTAIGGQLGSPRAFEVKGRRVEAFVARGLSHSPSEIGGWVEQIVTHQRQRMGVFDYPFYVVAIRPRANVIAGTAIDNLFIGFMRPDATRADIVRNISHEMFHGFIPDRLSLTSSGKEAWARHLWFSEGLVDYMARSLSMEQGLATASDLAGRFNRDLRDLSENPHASWPASAFESAAAGAGGLSQTMKNVSYARGALMAAHWDMRLRARGGPDLAEVLRRMIAMPGDEMSEERFFQQLARHDIGAGADFRRYVVRGESLEPDRRLLGPGYTIAPVDIPSFDPGFDLAATVETRSIAGVAAAGPAFAAGLRDGARLVRLENASRFSSSWDERRPLVVIAVVDGAERRFEVMPIGPARAVPQFVPAR